MGISELTEYALLHFGIPYQWGGEGPDAKGNFGFDCSGFIKRIAARGGIRFEKDLSSNDLFKFCVANGKPSEEEGAWVFFSDGKGNPVHHVGYLVTPEVLISAAGGGPKCISLAAANAMNASIKLQPLWWYRRFKTEGSFLPPYKFL